MTLIATDEKDRSPGRDGSLAGLALSIALHLIVLCALAFFFGQRLATQIVAAGPGEGGEGGGGSIEVGVADPSTILGFARPQTVSFLGDEDSPVNNARLETSRPEASDAEALLPPTEKDAPSPDAIKTDRPVANQQERIFTGREERGRSASSSAQLGRSFGSPAPRVAGGIGIGSGSGVGSGTGLPGGSAYGRLIQNILSRNYTPPAVDVAGVEYVIILVRIGRDGRILSISNGRVAPGYFRKRSSLALLNNAAERAVLAANPLPPFPAGFLGGASEAIAEVWFRYPK
ncbi:MAG TPA: TonB C-terminal domain-containing protein [Blastocatellia bacterium]|nr:TonB C-terminal domain-containing protein [Blastocatellia bacterium]